MPIDRRFLIAVLSTLTVTCAAPQRARAPAGDVAKKESPNFDRDEPLETLARPEGELASAPAASESAYVEEPLVRIQKSASAESRPSPPAAPPAKPAATTEPVRDRLTAKPVTRMRPAEAPAVPREAPAAPALKAGRHDDNKEYNRFLAFLAQNHESVRYSTDISERLLVRALDRGGRSLPNCPVTVKSTSGKVLEQTTTYADGSTQFFPAAIGFYKDDSYVVQVKCGEAIRNGQLTRAGRRDNEIRFDFARKVPTPMPVDVAIVLDTTGSMQGQIDRLKQTLKAIHFQLTSLPMHPDIRFGMVAYRDRGDSYLTRITQFTSNVESYQAMLENLYADGGGDTPEDLQSALDVAMHQLTWRRDALRIGFVITDAPPHTDYGQQYNYLAAMKESLSRGIKWVTVGAGGLGIDGEVIYRQIAQYSMGEYVFITQGSGGDSEGGTGEASHHVGGNYSTENLDQAIVRIVRRELSYLTDTPKDFDTTIVATGDKATPRDQILAPAVAEALRQLADYSSLKLGGKTLVAIVPVTSADKKYKSLAEYLTDQMILSASRNEFFKVVERDLAALSQEMKLQLSNLFDESATVPIGKMVGAQILIVSKLVVKGDGAELFSKLVRVETGEVLSVAKVQVTGGAGLGS